MTSSGPGSGNTPPTPSPNPPRDDPSPEPEAASQWIGRAKFVLLLLLLAAPLFGFAALRALKSTSNDPRQWLPRTFEETNRYDLFQSHFGSDEIAIFSWSGCTMDNPQVPELAAALAESPYFENALTGPDIFAELTDPNVGLSRSAAMRRLQGILIGPDQQTTCLVLSTSVDGRADRVRAVQEIEIQAARVAEVGPADLKMAGPTVDAAAIDIESRRLLFQLAGISALVSFIVASMRLGSIRLAVIVLMTAVYSTMVALSLLYLTGTKMNLLMTMLPPLIYVLSISSAVHLANYYRDAVVEMSSLQAIRVTVTKGWLPCSLAATTTAIGLASLVMSKIDPIKEFGVYSALGMIASIAVLFVLLPSALCLFPPKLRSRSTADEHAHSLTDSRRWNQRVIGAIGRHHGLALAGCLTLMALCGWALPSVRSTVKLQDRFLPGSDAIQDYVWLEQHIGPMVPLEVIVHFTKRDPRDLIERLSIVAAVQAKIQSLDQPVTTVSAINFSPPLPRGKSVRDVIGRNLIDRPGTIDRWTEAHLLANTDDEQLWRITVRANALGDLDYGRFAETIRAAVDPLLEEKILYGTYTGVIPLIYKAQRQLLDDLFRSFLAAFVVIALVLVMVLRSFMAALLAMIPNLFPAVVVFGGIEWIDIPVQIGSVMTASAALGIAVDDTVHFLTWFRRGLQRGSSRIDSLKDAFARCSGAMVQTTLICASGLLVFAASSFVPILHFAWLMVTLLLSALIGDLILLPAILAGPLGRWFEPKKRSE